MLKAVSVSSVVKVADVRWDRDYRIIRCPDCGGRGIPPDASRATCRRCDGWGKLAAEICEKNPPDLVLP